METFGEFVATPESEGLFEMANFSPKRTGLPFVVWISPKLALLKMFVSRFQKVRRRIFLN